jgi:hypothetical protein
VSELAVAGDQEHCAQCGVVYQIEFTGDGACCPDCGCPTGWEPKPQEEVRALALYDRMCSAIAECSRVDEAKDIRDKALALEAYYRQARNLDAEREAANVRLRAERRVGELLKELARADTAAGGDVKSASVRETPIQPSPYATALSEQGISRQAASRYQALANIPAPVFEQALSGPEKATTAGMLKHVEARQAVKAASASRTPTVSSEALWLWGTLRDFENDGYLSRPLAPVLADMTDAMRADVLRLAPHVITALSSLEPSE